MNRQFQRNKRRILALFGLPVFVLILIAFLGDPFLSIKRRLVQLRGGWSTKRTDSDLYVYKLANRQEYLMNHHHRRSVLHMDLRPGLPHKPRVFYTIFAGRKLPLSVQFEYIQKMLDDETIDEVHIWDYTCYAYNPNHEESRRYIMDTLWPMDDRIYYIRSQTCQWNEYYRFYNERPLQPDDVLIKADDDTVFIDTSQVAGFIQTIRNYRKVFLWSPNIINNGMAAAFQEIDGIIEKQHMHNKTKKTRLMDIEPRCPQDFEHCFSNNGTRGNMTHLAFLNDPKKFMTPIPGKELRQMQGRQSLNFIAILGKNYPRVAIHLRNHPHGDTMGGNDEFALTWGATMTNFCREINVMYMPLVVAHGSYGTQGLWDKDYVFTLYRDAMPRLMNLTSPWKLKENHRLNFPVLANT